MDDCETSPSVSECRFDGCDRRSRSLGLCAGHYRQHWQGRDLAPLRPRGRERAACTVDDCSGVQKARGYCSKHYQQEMGGGVDPTRPIRHSNRSKRCYGPACQRLARVFELCSGHYQQLISGRDLTILESRSAKQYGDIVSNPDNHGYVILWCPGHPNAHPSTNHLAEHREVMAKELGRALLSGENVHHKNGVRGDNRPENLELWVVSQPQGQRPADLVEWADEIIRRYR